MINLFWIFRRNLIHFVEYVVSELIIKICNIWRYGGGIKVEVLKVSAQSNPKSVAGALTAVLREKGSAEIQAVGAGAVNQAVKAIAITRGFDSSQWY